MPQSLCNHKITTRRTLKITQTHPVYRLYITPRRKVLLIHQNLALNPLSFPSKKKISDKEREHRLIAEEISAFLVHISKSSMDRNNFKVTTIKHGIIQHTRTKISLIILTITFNDGESKKSKYF